MTSGLLLLTARAASRTSSQLFGAQSSGSPAAANSCLLKYNLQPIDDYVADWDGWSLYDDGAKQAGLGDDGKTYGFVDHVRCGVG
jgi:hypothetical protein